MVSSKFSCREFLEIYSYKRATSITEVSYLETIFMSGRLVSSKFSCREFLEIYNTREPHQSQKWAIWRPFSWVGDDFVNFSCREFLEIYNTREPHLSQKWAIWRPFSWVGDDFVQIFMSRVFDIYNFMSTILSLSRVSWGYKRADQWWPIWRPFSWVFCRNFRVQSFSRSIIREPHLSQKWPIWRPFSWVGDDFVQIFIVESLLRYIVQKSHINHRSELSGDHFHEWALILSKFSCREFLEIYNTREPHQSQKWPIWRPFYWVGDDFVEIFMSRVSRDL